MAARIRKRFITPESVLALTREWGTIALTDYQKNSSRIAINGTKQIGGTAAGACALFTLRVSE